MNSGVHARFDLRRGSFSLAVDLRLPGRGVSAIVGPSGAGKTTLLRAIAGLDRHPGYLEVNGEVWQDDGRRLRTPVHKRPLGYVFQEASLLPHLDVRGNLEYGWKRASRSHACPEPAEVLRLLGIAQLLGRRPDTLSGGERQRVAIARALLAGPKLLLMDEPLASLDRARKQEVLPWLERLHEELAIPILYVSHAPDEVARLADHVVLLEQGGVRAAGSVTEMTAQLDLPMAMDEDAGVVVDAVVVSYDVHYRLATLVVEGNYMVVPHAPVLAGQHLRMRVRARDVVLALDRRDDMTALNQVAAVVVAQVPLPDDTHLLLRLDAGGMPLMARITCLSRDRLQLGPGMRIWAQFKASALLA
ncbi:MAG TPA: molybdenum ABC transporter ATP-binding protein [Noviherbaspirillum sp.]|jgi:molybdate transport system ATP-binding protein|uniref:molybdenum ABC transporter ATP-binding protein n=1 Tax=Noviherbaspirillum sp. TaxID=1926288 RepID=UPI002F9442F0